MKYTLLKSKSKYRLLMAVILICLTALLSSCEEFFASSDYSIAGDEKQQLHPLSGVYDWEYSHIGYGEPNSTPIGGDSSTTEHHEYMVLRHDGGYTKNVVYSGSGYQLSGAWIEGYNSTTQSPTLTLTQTGQSAVTRYDYSLDNKVLTLLFVDGTEGYWRREVWRRR